MEADVFWTPSCSAASSSEVASFQMRMNSSGSLPIPVRNFFRGTPSFLRWEALTEAPSLLIPSLSATSFTLTAVCHALTNSSGSTVTDLAILPPCGQE